MKIILLLLLLTSLAVSQSNVYIKDVSLQTSFENITIPNGEKMGLVGLNYLIHPNKYFYYGMGAFLGGGAITRPMAGLSYDIMDNFSFSVIGGKIIGLNGSLNANVLDLSIAYNFNKLRSHKPSTRKRK